MIDPKDRPADDDDGNDAPPASSPRDQSGGDAAGDDDVVRLEPTMDSFYGSEDYTPPRRRGTEK